jgi:hypothetical protein
MFDSTETWPFTGSSELRIGDSSCRGEVTSPVPPGGVQRGRSQPIGMKM